MVMAYIPPPEDFEDHTLLRHWWRSIYSDFGPYPSYAFFLALPSDKEAISYLTNYGQELHQLSGRYTLIITLGNIEFESYFLSDSHNYYIGEDWSKVVEDYILKGYSVEIAQIFDIDYTILPCLVIFRDIRSPEHVVVKLSNMTSEMISNIFRSIFSIIRDAESKGEDPIAAIERSQNQELFMSKGKTIIGKLSNIAEKTFESVLIAWAKSALGTG